ncbi:hypothetical protein F0562_031502 [Nyssa sinensis]|uniref:Uncharacterized protein n=1 Tax=Nyssa sinensis TaxID=561372 RepID=A0A5J5ASB7_9ASTE|nr:hypothetical protein F0562_031502 [Nyssa sinensis]
MAKPINICHVTATIFFFLIISQLSSARILNSFSSNNLAATELALNLALPGDSVSASSAGAPEKDSSQHVLPCEMDSNKNFHMDIPAPERLSEKYGRLLSSARILNSFSSNNLAATELALNLALPDDSVSASSAGAPEKDSSQHALPCEMDSNKNFHMDILAPERLSGKYGRLVLNMLPKGPQPPSGPSKGGNNINN